MNKTTSTIVLIAPLLLAGASVTGAQTMLDSKVFINVNAGAQTQSREVANAFTFQVYGQTASVAAVSSTDGGAFFDISAGYRFVRQAGVAVGFSRFKKTGSATGNASIPSPLFFNRPNSVTFPDTDAQREDRSTYVLLVWFIPVTNRIDVALSVGPSFTDVSQDLITSVTVPAGTQNAIPAFQKQSGTAKGANVGVDGTYLFTKQIGAGAFMRYNGGSVDLESASDVKTGGFQAGIGVRLRF